nr:mRNA (2'-O-methyladenosine-N(6)-)-methyltransferase-like [Danaus plexippus plexippus]
MVHCEGVGSIREYFGSVHIIIKNRRITEEQRLPCSASCRSFIIRNYSRDIFTSSPFLELRPVSGSLVAHPPYCEELLAAALRHMERLLQDSAEPLSFVVVLPEWPDKQTHALHKLQASHFKRKQVVIPAFEHEYRHGFQHVLPKNEVYFRS